MGESADLSILPSEETGPYVGEAGRFSWIGEELAPYPGRGVKVARTVAACAVAMLLAMTFRLPNAFLGTFYAFALSSSGGNTGHAVRKGLGTLAGVTTALVGTALFADYAPLRFLFVHVCFFLAFFAARVARDYVAAFGFGIVLVATTSVHVIWSSPNPLRPNLASVLGTSLVMLIGTTAAMAAGWVFAGESKDEPEPPEEASVFVADAFSNAAHVRFALMGCLAASICYFAWNAAVWPGIGVCTVTCAISAPHAPGSSRRRLSLRLMGLLLGGVVCGLGTQIFVLPQLDSIFGFAVLFSLVTAAAAWVAASSPRLAYAGRQMAIAYFLTVFQGFAPSASLAVSRDRVVGVLLGIVSMWVVFDVLIPKERAA